MDKKSVVFGRLSSFIEESTCDFLKSLFLGNDWYSFHRLIFKRGISSLPGYAILENISGGKSIWFNVKMRNIITGEFALARTWSMYHSCRSHFSSNRYALSPFKRLLLEAIAHDYLGKRNMAPPLLFFDIQRGILLRSFWPGETLGVFLEKARTFNEKKAIMEVVVDFVERMHEDGFFHGDLSLDNILFREESLDSIYAIDFEWAWMNFIYEDLSKKELRSLDLQRFFSRVRKHSPEFTALLEKVFHEKNFC